MENKYLKGIDISEFNGIIDFKMVKNQVDFIMIRATFGRFGLDKKFEFNVNECLKYDIPFGFYFYSYATDEEKVIEETKFFLEKVKPYVNKASFPFVIDMEDSDKYKENHGNPNKEKLTNICIKACELIKEQKLIPCIYANKEWFEKKLDLEKLEKYYKWLAWWNEEAIDKIDKKQYQMLQYSSKGVVLGVSGKVDVNYSFVDFAKAKQYLENLSKITFIKLVTGFEDITIQFFSCYKHGQDLIDKVYARLQKPKVEKKPECNKAKEVQKEYGFETKTINFILSYLYGEEAISKLYNAIVLEK